MAVHRHSGSVQPPRQRRTLYRFSRLSASWLIFTVRAAFAPDLALAGLQVHLTAIRVAAA